MGEILDAIEKFKKPKKVLEKDVEKYFRSKIRSIGGMSWKFTSPNNRGVSDQVMLFHGRTIFVELKTDTGRMTQLQKVFQSYVDEHLGEFVCLKGKQGVDDFIEHLKQNKLIIRSTSISNHALYGRLI